MNVENINKAIAVMKRVHENEQKLERTLLDMAMFQRIPITFWSLSDYFESEEEVLNHCGTTCCFAGWIAVSPEFQEIGVIASRGKPRLHECKDVTKVVGKLLDIPFCMVDDLIYKGVYDGRDIFTSLVLIEVLEDIKGKPELQYAEEEEE